MIELDRKFEEEFACRCEEIQIHHPVQRMTLDREWTEDELIDNIYDVCTEVMTDKLLKKYKNRALKDENLLKIPYMSEHIECQIEDVIELYNKEYDKHRHEKCFGIKWYDEAIKRMINSELRRNVP